MDPCGQPGQVVQGKKMSYFLLEIVVKNSLFNPKMFDLYQKKKKEKKEKAIAMQRDNKQTRQGETFKDC